MTQRAAVFLDRDGVIIQEVGYLNDPDQVELVDGAGEAIAKLNAAGLATVVVTNQAGVARGLFPEENVPRVHARLDDLLASHGARIDRYYHCPHHPHATVERYAVDCECRKPRPGMLRRAAEELELSLADSWLVGDKASDLQAAMAATCQPLLVMTGYGAATASAIKHSSLASATRQFASLAEAVGHLLRRV
jgi:D-glycero-D-manno-heptose 1,7-bisphosphate phosphatase